MENSEAILLINKFSLFIIYYKIIIIDNVSFSRILVFSEPVSGRFTDPQPEIPVNRLTLPCYMLLDKQHSQLQADIYR